jgi:hypothetical protein
MDMASDIHVAWCGYFLCGTNTENALGLKYRNAFLRIPAAVRGHPLATLRLKSAYERRSQGHVFVYPCTLSILSSSRFFW